MGSLQTWLRIVISEQHEFRPSTKILRLRNCQIFDRWSKLQLPGLKPGNSCFQGNCSAVFFINFASGTENRIFLLCRGIHIHNVPHMSALFIKLLSGWLVFFPTEQFTILEAQNPSIHVSGQHKFRRFTDFEALKMSNVRSGLFYSAYVKRQFVNFSEKSSSLCS